MPGWEDYVKSYQTLMGPRGQNSQYSPDNPFTAPAQGGEMPQVNAFSRILPNHGRIAEALDNAAMMAALVPERDTVGGNISGVAQAFLGLPQAKLQRAAAMIKPAQDWENQQAEINQKNMSAFGNLLQGRYWAERPELEREATAAGERENALRVGAQSPYDVTEHIDDDGNLHKFNTRSKKMEQVTFNGEFLNEKKQQRLATTTEFQRLLSGEMMETINNEREMRGEPLLTQQQTVDLYMRTRGQLAGATAGGSQAATSPEINLRDFINQQEAKVYEGTPEPEENYIRWQTQNYATGDLSMEAFERDKQARLDARAESDRLFGLYRRSDAPGKGVSFSNWRRQNGIPNPGQSTAPAGPKWNPTSGRYE